MQEYGKLNSTCDSDRTSGDHDLNSAVHNAQLMKEMSTSKRIWLDVLS